MMKHVAKKHQLTYNKGKIRTKEVREREILRESERVGLYERENERKKMREKIERGRKIEYRATHKLHYEAQS